jgi:hypothetical protein
MTDQTDPKRDHIATVRETKGGVPRPGDVVWKKAMTEDEYERWRRRGCRVGRGFKKTTAE